MTAAMLPLHFEPKLIHLVTNQLLKVGTQHLFFISYFIMANTWKMLLTHLIAFGSCHFLWQNQWLSDEYWWTTSTKSGLFHCTYNELNGDLTNGNNE